MFNKRRSLIPTRKDPAKPERAAEPPPRIDLPSFRPAERKAGPRIAQPAPRAAAQPVRPMSLPQAGAPAATARAAPTVARPAQPVAQPIARPVAQPITAPSAPGPGAAHTAGAAAPASQAVGRVMLVGPDIRLSAEIRACERLVVEGTVEGELNEAQRLEVARGGRFRGTAEVDSCVVDGLFEGELTVHGALALKANGRVSGTVRYGEIEIERGGTIAGNFGTHGAPEGAAALRPAGNGAAAGRRPA